MLLCISAALVLLTDSCLHVAHLGHSGVVVYSGGEPLYLTESRYPERGCGKVQASIFWTAPLKNNTGKLWPRWAGPWPPWQSPLGTYRALKAGRP